VRQKQHDNPERIETMQDKTRKALIHIAMLEDGKDYKAVSKTQLWESLKYARHLAKCSLEAERTAQ
jgi:accessory colonization factor AcfC